MQPTNISWADYSWNPQTGCSRAGPICYDAESEKVKCYAEKLSRQQGRTQEPWTVENASENITFHEERLEEPNSYNWPEGPGRVFVGSMTDMFHSETDPGKVQSVLDKCREYPEHIWIWLTKRPHHAAEWRLDWPENTMLGVSVGSSGKEYPSTTHRIEQLRDVDAPMKWVSFEPLLEPMPELALDHLDWMVVGGESHKQTDDRREMEHEWARELLGQAREQDVAYWFKQSSGPYPEHETRLTVENEEFGVYEQREVHEFPELPEVTKKARQEVIA